MTPFNRDLSGKEKAKPLDIIKPVLDLNQEGLEGETGLPISSWGLAKQDKLICRPTYQDGVYRKDETKKCVRFDGANDTFLVPKILTSNAFTIITMFQADQWGTLLKFDGFELQSNHIIISKAAGIMYSQPDNNWNLVVVRKSPGTFSTKTDVWLNGELQYLPIMGQDDPVEVKDSELTIGHGRAGYFKGHLGLLQIYAVNLAYTAIEEKISKLKEEWKIDA